MQAVRTTNTLPEVVLKKALRKALIQYRSGDERIFGKPDILMMGKKIAIFVDGDFWHGNQWKKRGFDSLEDQFKKIKSRQYWIAKIKRNISRDRKVSSRLKKSGWTVIRLWESEIKQEVDKCVSEIKRAISLASGHLSGKKERG